MLQKIFTTIAFFACCNLTAQLHDNCYIPDDSLTTDQIIFNISKAKMTYVPFSDFGDQAISNLMWQLQQRTTPQELYKLLEYPSPIVRTLIAKTLLNQKKILKEKILYKLAGDYTNICVYEPPCVMIIQPITGYFMLSNPSSPLYEGLSFTQKEKILKKARKDSFEIDNNIFDYEHLSHDSLRQMIKKYQAFEKIEQLASFHDSTDIPYILCLFRTYQTRKFAMKAMQKFPNLIFYKTLFEQLKSDVIKIELQSEVLDLVLLYNSDETRIFLEAFVSNADINTKFRIIKALQQNIENTKNQFWSKTLSLYKVHEYD